MGNQLFQAAFGLAQSMESRCALFFDCEGVAEDQLKFLEAWVGPLERATDQMVMSLKGEANSAGKLYRSFQGLIPFPYRSWVLQRTASFRKDYLSPRSMAYFDGYWQSYQYFQNVAQAIRASFYYRPALPPKPRQLISQMSQGETVSLHVRRGDYSASDVFGVVPEAFYSLALDRLAQEVSIERVFVFSDDPVWCRDQLSLGRGFVVVEGNSPPVDLALMSSCRHHIVGTSTFSWWGAWLGQTQNGRVIAPRTWFASYGAIPPLDDIFPPEWTLI